MLNRSFTDQFNILSTLKRLFFLLNDSFMWHLCCSATRRRQCSLFLLISDLFFLPSSITFSSSLYIKYHLYPVYSFSPPLSYSPSSSSSFPAFSLSPSCEGLIDRSGFCQHRRGTLNFKPSDVDPSPLRHCDLSPFTLPPKQTGHDPPPESRSHSSLGTRREESDADGNQFFFFSPQSCFSESSFL